MPLTSPGNDDGTGENHQPTLRKNTAEPAQQTLKQYTYEGRPVRRGRARGRHRCSADRANAGRGVIVGLRALEVEVLDSSGKHLATHPRAYGQASTNSEDPSMQLALLCNKPASWPNSRVRDALPDPLREWLDRQDRQTRNEALQTLKRVDRESGWANAVEAMLSILESTGGADRAGVTLLAARLAEGVAGIEYDDDRPDPGEYDIAFTADVGVQEGGR